MLKFILLITLFFNKIPDEWQGKQNRFSLSPIGELYYQISFVGITLRSALSSLSEAFYHFR